MGRRLRIWLLALSALVVAATGGSLTPARGTPRASLADEGAWFVVDAAGGEYPELDFSLSLGDGAPPAQLVLYAPAGFALYPDRPAGTLVGAAQAFAADGSFGVGGAAVLAGTITAVENDPDAAPDCGQGKRLALWQLQLSLLGQPLEVPIAISTAGPDAPEGAALRLDFCLPRLPAANGALLPINQLRISLDELEAPTARGSYVWHAFVTPVAPDRRTPLQDKTYELRALVPVPHLVTLRGRYDGKKHAALLHGRVTAAGEAQAGVRVWFVRLVRRVTPRGVIFDDSEVGSVRTSSSGRFTFKAPLRRTAGFVAVVHDVLGRCRGASSAPGGCASTSTTGGESEPVTVSIPHRRKT